MMFKKFLQTKWSGKQEISAPSPHPPPPFPTPHITFLMFNYLHSLYSLVLFSNQSILYTLTCPKVKCRSPLICKTNYQNRGINVCEPPCPWLAFSSSEDLALEIVDNFSIAVGLVVFFIVFFTWINNKHL